jgi:hypothetical protein
MVWMCCITGCVDMNYLFLLLLYLPFGYFEALDKQKKNWCLQFAEGFTLGVYPGGIPDSATCPSLPRVVPSA